MSKSTKKMSSWVKGAALTTVLSAVLLVNPISSPLIHAAKVTSGTSYVLFQIDKKEVFLNGEIHTLNAAPFVQGGSTYVPAKFLGDAFGMDVTWDAAAKEITLKTPSHLIIFNNGKEKLTVNGKAVPFGDGGKIVNGSLMIKLTWLSEYMNAKYTYNHDVRTVEVIYNGTPNGVYDPDKKNSTPIAKFAFAKDTYRKGEPIKYVNLSYDPDGDGLQLKWEGKQDAFFEAGTYPITLTVTDKSGNISKSFTRNVEITDEHYLSELEFPIYQLPVGGIVKTNWNIINKHYSNFPDLSKTVTNDTSRSLLMSDSPETFYQTGILYQDIINGKGRLYADHFNGTGETVGFAILATNTTDEPITVRTTRQGEVFPSIYANLIGSEAMVDFLLDEMKPETMVVPPFQTFIYKQFPKFDPKQGVNLMYDLETDGDLTFTFAAAKEVSEDMLKMPKLPFEGHIRGTFQIAGFDWDIDMAANPISKPHKLVLGDGKVDLHYPGYDPQSGVDTVLKSNYGTIYKINIKNPEKMAVMLLPRAGVFKGPFKVNGEIVKVPSTGTLTAFNGMSILAKTTGEEDMLTLEYSPPANSSFPIHIIFYPLEDLE
ncbi:stalk domain-containing protein [Paenibacillus yanchengensis]|uniref:Stalk domain-containing protein n=1 Tax=Paenibacillus yanchengensis TaxID=2035833 RepID=A0ABW4YM41_9BACL